MAESSIGSLSLHLANSCLNKSIKMLNWNLIFTLPRKMKFHFKRMETDGGSAFIPHLNSPASVTLNSIQLGCPFSDCATRPSTRPRHTTRRKHAETWYYCSIVSYFCFHFAIYWNSMRTTATATWRAHQKNEIGSVELRADSFREKLTALFFLLGQLSVFPRRHTSCTPSR